VNIILVPYIHASSLHSWNQSQPVKPCWVSLFTNILTANCSLHQVYEGTCGIILFSFLPDALDWKLPYGWIKSSPVLMIHRSLLSHIEKLLVAHDERLLWSRRGSNPVPVGVWVQRFTSLAFRSHANICWQLHSFHF
jgi:hypothetical protein